MAEDLSILREPDWLLKFEAQARKDFELAGASSCLPVLDTGSLEALQACFRNAVLELESKQLLPNLLYRIDLTEKQVSDAVRSQPGKAVPEVLAELMIKRLLQKVVLKEWYK